MIEKPEPAPRKDCENEEYYSCVMCGAGYVYYELRFDTATAAATVGETISGITSNCTGVVVSSALESGSYAGGDAAGTLELSGVTGATDDLAFTDNEGLSGTSTFSGMANGQAIGKHYGLVYPAGDMAERDGKRYCTGHFNWRFIPKDRDASKVDVEE
jgi:hypothetical protein